MDNSLAQSSTAQVTARPFSLLAPEMVEHILKFLSDIPSLMAASGVCRLWRELVHFNNVNQLHLNFAQSQISDAPIKMPKWSNALESLLPNVDLNTLQVTLPNKLTPKTKQPGLYLVWPLSLLDCGLTVNQQEASLSSITNVRISGRPDNPEFEFSCHLLELCPSITHLNLSLTSDKFPFALLTSALSNKPLVEFNLSIAQMMGYCSYEDLAQLCQVSAPGTLKSLTLVTGNRHTAETLFHEVFSFDMWCRALEGETMALAGVEELFIGTSHFMVNELFPDTLHNLPQFAQLVHQIMPSLKHITFSVPLVDTWHWPKMYIAIEMMSLYFLNKVDVRLLTSHCKTSFIYVYLHQQEGAGDKIITETGFRITPEAANRHHEHMTITYDRMPPTAPSACQCNVCLSEFHWVKQRIISHLEDGIGSQPSAVDDFKLFSCIIPRLRSDLLHIYPTVSISKLVKGMVKIGIDGNTALTAEGFMLNSYTVGDDYSWRGGKCTGAETAAVSALFVMQL